MADRLQKEPAQAEAQHNRRYLHTFYDESGMLLLQGRLPPELGTVLWRRWRPR